MEHVRVGHNSRKALPRKLLESTGLLSGKPPPATTKIRLYPPDLVLRELPVQVPWTVQSAWSRAHARIAALYLLSGLCYTQDEVYIAASYASPRFRIAPSLGEAEKLIAEIISSQAIGPVRFVERALEARINE